MLYNWSKKITDISARFSRRNSKKMDESGVEPETFRMLSERATNYATRPDLAFVKWLDNQDTIN